MVTVPPRTASRIDLPQREVDGSMGQNGSYVMNSGPGTFVSPHAFLVVSPGPVVVYQFNPIIPPQDNTHVTVTPNHPITPSGGDSGIAIPLVPKHGSLDLTLSRYEVANLESDQLSSPSPIDCISKGQDGDFTGSVIHADKPVAEFTSAERGSGFGGATNVVYPPDWVMSGDGADDICCTDHLEEQLLPTTALGREFAIARSPIRSTDSTGWVEPDIVRVVGTVDGTVVTTNLPAPYDSFPLGASGFQTIAATRGFTMTANNAIEVATYLVPQHFVKHGYIGDPSQLLMPAAEQFRKDYVFLVPGTFQSNYIVLAKPVDAMVVLDGTPLVSAEQSGCTTGPLGLVG